MANSQTSRDLVVLGDNLRSIRDRMGLKQHEFASYLGLSESMYAKTEAGNRVPSVKSGFYDRLARLPGVSETELELIYESATGLKRPERPNDRFEQSAFDSGVDSLQNAELRGWMIEWIRSGQIKPILDLLGPDYRERFARMATAAIIEMLAERELKKLKQSSTAISFAPNADSEREPLDNDKGVNVVSVR